MKNMPFCKCYVFTILLVTATVVGGYSQWIDSLKVFPAEPTIVDHIEVRAYVTYPETTCELVTQDIIFDNFSICGKAIHCQQLSPALCEVVDTFKLGLLKKGIYTFHFWPGFDSLCNSPQLPFPFVMDSIVFEVHMPVGINDPSKELSAVQVFPNPARHRLHLSSRGLKLPADFQLFDVTGRQVWQDQIQEAEQDINIAHLPPGSYWYRVMQNDEVLKTGKIVVH